MTRLKPVIHLLALIGVVSVAVVALDRSGSAPVLSRVASSAGTVKTTQDVPSRPFGTVQGSRPHARLTLLRLRRTGPKVVSVQVAATLDRRADSAWLTALAGDGNDTDNGLRLIDEVNGREHFPLKDADGRCLCSRAPLLVYPGDRFVVGAKFPAPPADVDYVSLQAPGFPSFDRVPLES